jgi:uncharacterized protein YdaU (DUF1376 family)
MKETSPAFQFYPKDFLSDPNTLVMTAEAVGAYWLLISTLWQNCELPINELYLSSIARVPIDRFTDLWERYLRRCFVETDDGMIRHKRLDKERELQELRRNRQSEGGKAGMETRWKKKKSRANKVVITSDNSPSPSPSPSPDVNTPLPPKKSKSKKHAYAYEESELPERLRTYPGFSDAWLRWLEYRSGENKALSVASAKAQLKFLAEQPNPYACIEQSIRNQWQGLFPEKNNGKSKNNYCPDAESNERLKRILGA